MTERSVKCWMDKRKVCVFLILVGIAIACLCVLIYTLFYAMPHAGSPIKNGPQSLIRRDMPRVPRTLAEADIVRSS
jgi:hypothetical protein